MTVFIPCDCAPANSLCSLEEALKAILENLPGFGNFGIYTGDLITQADIPNGDRLTPPYVIISDRGENNSRRVGEQFTRHEIIVRLLVYSATDQQGIRLATEAIRAFREAGVIETIDGWVCRHPLPGRARPRKVAGGFWITQINQAFFVYST